ncbi:MAG: hypothetical protein IJQ10_00640 [Clostridia bacterium]|nr:hypothetical protein [Clostridia bacterium]
MQYNYILLNEGFYRWLETNHLQIQSQLLFLKLIHLFNVSGWSEWLAVDNQRMMSLVQTKREQTFIDWRDRLMVKKLIFYTKGKKGSPNKYKLNDEITFINEAKTGVKTGVQSAIQTADIYKQNKTKLKKENTANAVQKKTACGEFGNVFLTKNEFEKLESQYPQEFEAIIDYLSSYIEMKGYKAKSHYLAIQKWVVLAYREQKKREENLIRGVNYGSYSQQKPRKICTEYPE